MLTDFEREGPHLRFSPELYKRLRVAFEQVYRSYYERHQHRTGLLQSHLQVLLYETDAAYTTAASAAEKSQSRAYIITRQFKQLVQTHCLRERHVTFYASELCVTSKHLSETVWAVTGRGATAWIAEAVTLEARLLLQNATLTVAQVAEQLHFADQSAFGRYFRHTVGLSPSAYRQQR